MKCSRCNTIPKNRTNTSKVLGKDEYIYTMKYHLRGWKGLIKLNVIILQDQHQTCIYLGSNNNEEQNLNYKNMHLKIRRISSIQIV